MIHLEENGSKFDLDIWVFLGFVMGWRYKAGLFLIAAVVVIWVTSAEVTQVRFLSNFSFDYCFQDHANYVMIAKRIATNEFVSSKFASFFFFLIRNWFMRD